MRTWKIKMLEDEEHFETWSNLYLLEKTGTRLSYRQVYTHYILWCEQKNYRKLSVHKIAKLIRRKYLVEKKQARWSGEVALHWIGLSLKEEIQYPTSLRQTADV